jgi:riboflavin synthase
MFTGIVEEVGRVRSLTRGRDSASLQIEAAQVLKDARPGDSIAVNGVCLTVTGIAGSAFTADVMNETLNKTNLGSLYQGGRVNLERALALGDRLGGHLVTGHVDATGVIVRLTARGIETEMWVDVPDDLERYLIPQGSVALDGVSLTVAGLRAGALMVGLIPHTKQATTLGAKKTGDLLNIEADLLGKYVCRLLLREGGGRAREGGGQGRQGISEDFLLEHGYR